MADLDVVWELRLYLIAQGVAQDWNTAVSTTKPGIMLNPRDGAPQPRPGEEATVTLVDTMLAAPNSIDAYLEESFIDVIVRSRNAGTGKLLHRQIRGLLHPIGDHRGRQLWTMNTLLVEYSTIWRGEQPVQATDVDWVRSAGYRFGCRRKALAGLPYVP